MNLFNWRPMATAPRDGTEIVAMRVVTHVGGWARPIDITPEFEHVRRAEYWQRVIPPAMRALSVVASVGDDDLARGWWTTPQEYAAAVPLDRGWRSAPTFVQGFVVCPLVFIRPAERLPGLEDFGPLFDADVAWRTGSGPADGWRTVRGHNPTRHAHLGYLDGENVAAGAFRWLMLSEFFPPELFEQQIETEHQVHESRVAEWRRRAHICPTCLDLVAFADGELEPAREIAFRKHLPDCAACQPALVETMQLSSRLSTLKKDSSE